MKTRGPAPSGEGGARRPPHRPHTAAAAENSRSQHEKWPRRPARAALSQSMRAGTHDRHIESPLLGSGTGTSLSPPPESALGSSPQRATAAAPPRPVQLLLSSYTLARLLLPLELQNSSNLQASSLLLVEEAEHAAGLAPRHGLDGRLGLAGPEVGALVGVVGEAGVTFMIS